MIGQTLTECPNCQKEIEEYEQTYHICFRCGMNLDRGEVCN